DTVYSFSNEGDFTGGVLFDFEQKALPERLRRDVDEFAETTESSNYNYFTDTPFKVNQVWIGRMVNEGKSATFVYDNTSDKYYFYHNNLDYASVDTPMFVNSKYIVGAMDIGGYNYVKNKPPLNSSAMAVLEDGGHILTFYHLKQNGK
ncbi:MAG: hypothetical protein LBK58_06845, partial [Prevotellaceae bacterium]|nr:hypothetical protein [Prevotellaceae bacterium]